MTIVLITGGTGQLGQALIDCAPAGVRMATPDRAALDLADAASIAQAVAAVRPAIIINAAAYTAVDRAESAQEAAFQVNADAVGHLRAAGEAVGARLIHVSTDFVFDGAQSHPYMVDDRAHPLSVYGASKYAGEQAAGQDALILRTAWVYSAGGHNFLRTMLRLMAERPHVNVVADQVGTPTSARNIARALWALIGQGAVGVHHYTDAGIASWYDFAMAIAEEAYARGLLAAMPPVNPIPTSGYPTPARRPAYSVLDCHATWRCLDWRPPHWRAALRAVLEEMKDRG